MCRCCYSLTHSHKTAHSHRFSHHTRYLAAAVAAVCLPTPTPPTDHYYSLHKSDTTQSVSVPCLSVLRRCCRCGGGCACAAAAATTTTTNSDAVVLLFVGDRLPQCVDAALSHTHTTAHHHTSLTSLCSAAAAAPTAAVGRGRLCYRYRRFCFVLGVHAKQQSRRRKFCPSAAAVASR